MTASAQTSSVAGPSTRHRVVVLALSTVGVAAGSAGALLITLPVLSIPSMAMVGRVFSWRVTVAMAGAVAVAGLVSAALLWALL